MEIHGKEYTEVKDRIRQFLLKYPNGKITSEVSWRSENCHAVMFRAFVYPEWDKPDYFFTGFAYEERSKIESQVNSDAWVENCETSAIGRALANMDIGVNTARPSAEEMKKVNKNKKEPVDDIEEQSRKLLAHAYKKIETASNKELDDIQNAAFKYLGEGKLTQAHYDEIIKTAQSHYIPR